MDDSVFDHNILGIKNIRVANDRRKVFTEFIQRRMGTVIAGFHFYGGNFLSLGNLEIYFHVVFPVPTIGAGIEIQA